MRYVKAYGVELEGGWDETPPRRDLLKRDGSVNVQGSSYVGEMPSEVIRRLPVLRAFLADNYPDHVGESCGFHIHVSFGSREQTGAVIGMLGDSPDFQTYMIEGLTKWGKETKVRNETFWKRLRGGNPYCRTEFDPENGLLRGERYRALNFAAFNRHGTLEVRVLPMFRKASTAYKAARRVVSLIDTYVDFRIRDGLEIETVAEHTVAAGPETPPERIEVTIPI